MAPSSGVSTADAVLETGVAVVGKSPTAALLDAVQAGQGCFGGGVVIILLIFLALFGGQIAERISGHPQNEPYNSMTDDFGIPKGPNSQFWFGADGAGRDLFVRTMYGARTSLLVGIVASGIAVAIGAIIGLLSGYYGRWADTTLSRFADVMLAVPQLLISIGIVAACGTTKEGCFNRLIQPA